MVRSATSLILPQPYIANSERSGTRPPASAAALRSGRPGAANAAAAIRIWVWVFMRPYWPRSAGFAPDGSADHISLNGAWGKSACCWRFCPTGRPLGELQSAGTASAADKPQGRAKCLFQATVDIFVESRCRIIENRGHIRLYGLCTDKVERQHSSDCIANHGNLLRHGGFGIVRYDPPWQCRHIPTRLTDSRSARPLSHRSPVLAHRVQQTVNGTV